VGGLFGRLPKARYARFTGVATHPAGARPSKCIITIQWTEVLLFLSASPDLTVAAMEHVGRDSTIYAGYDTPEFVPRHATDLLIWLCVS
jgi:hypothetical protein